MASASHRPAGAGPRDSVDLEEAERALGTLAPLPGGEVDSKEGGWARSGGRKTKGVAAVAPEPAGAAGGASDGAGKEGAAGPVESRPKGLPPRKTANAQSMPAMPPPQSKDGGRGLPGSGKIGKFSESTRVAGVHAGGMPAKGNARGGAGVATRAGGGVGLGKGGWSALRTKAPKDIVSKADAEKRARIDRRMRLWRGVSRTIGALMTIREAQLFRSRLFGRLEGIALSLEEQEERARRDFLRGRKQLKGWRRVEAYVEENLLVWPSSRFARMWDVAYLCAVIWITVRVPYLVAFEPVESWTFLDIADPTAEIVFYLDVVLSFLMVSSRDGEELTTLRQIARAYVRGWFFFDLLAAFPYTLVFTQPAWRAAKVIRLVRIGKTEALEERVTVHLDLGEKARHSLRLFKLTFYTVSVAHIAACIWYYIAIWEGMGPNSWPVLADVADEVESLPKYVTAVYWAAATLTTVGYGDVSAHTTAERVFSLVMLMVGAAVFGLVVGKMSSLAQSMNEHVHVVKRKHNVVDQFLKFRRIPRELRLRTREYYDYLAKHKSFIDEGELLEDMSPALRRAILRSMNKDIIDAVPLFKFLSVGFQNTIATKLKPTFCLPQEYLIIAGDVVTEIYFIKEGRVQIIGLDGFSNVELERGSVVGENDILDRARSRNSVRAVVTCEFLMLTRADLMDVLEDFPEFEQTLRQVSQWRETHAGRMQAAAKSAAEGEDKHKAKVQLAANFAGALGGPKAQRAKTQVNRAARKIRRWLASCAKPPAPPRAVRPVARVMSTPHSLRRESSWSSTGSKGVSGEDRPATAPMGHRDWVSVASELEQGGQFTQKYQKILRQSRVMQAQLFDPTPAVLDQVALPDDVAPLVEGLAESAHDMWAIAQYKAGVRWGPTSDNAKKLEADLVPWDELADESQDKERTMVEQVLLHLLWLGFTIRPIATEDVLDGSGTPIPVADAKGDDALSATAKSSASLFQHLGKKKSSVASKYLRFSSPGAAAVFAATSDIAGGSAAAKESSATGAPDRDVADEADELVAQADAEFIRRRSSASAAAVETSASPTPTAAAGAAGKGRPSSRASSVTSGMSGASALSARRVASGVIIEYRSNKKVSRRLDGLTEAADARKLRQYHPEGIDTGGVEIPPEVREYLPTLASNAHEVWARILIDSGWVFGHHVDAAARRHHLLLPWRFLTDDLKRVYHDRVAATIKSVLALGYEIAPVATKAEDIASLMRADPAAAFSVAEGGPVMQRSAARRARNMMGAMTSGFKAGSNLYQSSQKGVVVAGDVSATKLFDPLRARPSDGDDPFTLTGGLSPKSRRRYMGTGASPMVEARLTTIEASLAQLTHSMQLLLSRSEGGDGGVSPAASRGRA